MKIELHSLKSNPNFAYSFSKFHRIKVNKMTGQKLTYSSQMVASFILLSILAHLGSASKISEFLNKDYDYEKQQLAILDAISLSIQELGELGKFANSIPRLRSMFTAPGADLVDCVNDLTSKSDLIRSTLQRLRHLKAAGLISDTYSLKDMLDQAMISGIRCRRTFNDFDGVLASMLTRKIDNLALILDDVLYRITKLEYGRTLHPKAGKNP